MKCDFCHDRIAEIFIEKGEGDEKYMIHLCTECARKGEFDLQGRNLEGSVRKLLVNLKESLGETSSCPVCGQTLNEMRRHHVAGCPRCYTEFASEIETYFEKQGKTGDYRGTVPMRYEQKRSILESRASLQNKLDESIANEEYEKAAVYRDKLKEFDERND